MGGMSPAALPCRVGNVVRDKSMEVSQMKLIAETATLLADSMNANDVAGECCDYIEKDSRKEVSVLSMEEGEHKEKQEISLHAGDEDGVPSLDASSSSLSSLSNSCSIRRVNEDAPTPDTVGDPTSSRGPFESLPNDLRSISLNVGVNGTGVSSLVEDEPGCEGLLSTGQPEHGSPRSRAIHQVASTSDYVPLCGYVSICGRRSEMEDAMAVIPRFAEIPNWLLGDVDVGVDSMQTGSFFGVYDGHGGAEVASYCGGRIHTALLEEFRCFAKDEEGKQDHILKKWKKVFTGSFSKVDAEVGGQRTNAAGSSSVCTLEPIAPKTAGSTAVVAVVCTSHVIIANCGDSRAVLCRGKQPVALSLDHKPSREDEYARIEAAGGKVFQWNGYRVFGVLAMSRSIGDRYLKPWIIPEPEVTCTTRTRQDECLILASDGLWDVLSNEEVCTAARKMILHWHRNNSHPNSMVRGEGADPAAQAAADHLCKLALRRGSNDNITVVVIDLKGRWKFKCKA